MSVELAAKLLFINRENRWHVLAGRLAYFYKGVKASVDKGEFDCDELRISPEEREDHR